MNKQEVWVLSGFTQEEGLLDGNGFHFKGNKYKTYTDLEHADSMLYSLTGRQKVYATFFLIAFLVWFFVDWHTTLVAILAVLIFIYFSDLLFSLFLIHRGFSMCPEIKIPEKDIQNVPDKMLPIYTIFCPLYKEWQVFSQFVKAIERLDYPKDKLQVLLLLEEDDAKTIEEVQKILLPFYFEVLIVPHSFPKTKPKACNYGLLHAKGDYCVIYDAEDIPESSQLKKVVAAFQNASTDVICIQAKLNFYNPTQNILTRLFTAEYSLWFDLILTGLQSVKAPIPLGGTSNHFRTRNLRLLKGWDAFNVTEDCDLGIRLAKDGFTTAIIDSVTWEEANSDFKNWFNQRTRWIKGYIQTYLVHMRRPEQFIKSAGGFNFLSFQLIVGGKVLSLFVNPMMWVLSILYFIFRPTLGLFIESFFPPTVFYIGVLSMLCGNFIYFYSYMMGCAKRRDYALIKYAFLVPIYWLCMSAASWIALYRLVTQPHYWFKTRHGLHLAGQVQLDTTSAFGADDMRKPAIISVPL